MLSILLSNDDGVNAPGLVPLRQALSSIGDVTVVAPERNQSAVSHKVTMHKPVRLNQTTLADGSTAYYCSGTPADSVRIGLSQVVDKKPDLIVSGINLGHNMGIDVYYSGTVACAREGAIQGIRSVAVSSVFPQVGGAKMNDIWAVTAETAVSVIQEALRNQTPPNIVLNINSPALTRDELKGVKVTHIGSRNYTLDFTKSADPFARPYYWLLGEGPHDEYDSDSDVGAVKDGYISVTPINLDPTANEYKATVESWNLNG